MSKAISIRTNINGVDVTLDGDNYRDVLDVLGRLTNPNRREKTLSLIEFHDRLKAYCAHRHAIDSTPEALKSSFNAGAAYVYADLLELLQSTFFDDDTHLLRIYDNAAPHAKTAMRQAGFNPHEED